MQAYSEIVAEARACFLRMQEHGIRSTEDILLLWHDTFAIGKKFAEYSPLGGIRFAQADFDSSTWKLASKLFEPLVQAGCVERRQGDRRIGGALVLKSDVTSEVLATTVKPKREYKKRAPIVVTETVYQKGDTRIIEKKPARKEGQESRAVVIDIANVTKRHGTNGKPLLPINRINWNAFRNALQVCDGKMVPLERLVLCVSAGYAADNRFALSLAQRVGFTVETKYGDKGADPVVGHQIRNVVITAVVNKYLDRVPTIVLVSGDADFCGDLDDMEELARLEGLALPIHIISWEESLARLLGLRASKTTALDDMVRHIRLP